MISIMRNYDLRRLYKSVDAAVNALIKLYPKIITDELYFYYNEARNDLIMALNYLYSIDLGAEVHDFANLWKLARHAAISLFEGVFAAEIANEDSYFQEVTLAEKVEQVMENSIFEDLEKYKLLIQKAEIFVIVSPYESDLKTAGQKQEVLRTILQNMGDCLYVLYKEILCFYNDGENPLLHCDGCGMPVDGADYLWTACAHCIRKAKKAYDDFLHGAFLIEVSDRNFSICMD